MADQKAAEPSLVLPSSSQAIEDSLLPWDHIALRDRPVLTRDCVCLISSSLRGHSGVGSPTPVYSDDLPSGSAPPHSDLRLGRVADFIPAVSPSRGPDHRRLPRQRRRGQQGVGPLIRRLRLPVSDI
ncbi:hypothetical protein D1007_37239 [Hordeum vulgare]|nr:hypothetical protein D1007_37239 [Hordeum vulgare]